MTVTDPDSIGILIDGDKAIVNNDGDNAISNGGTGTQINGDEATVNNNGNTTVDGQGSTGTEIAGNNAVVNQDGTLDVSGGAHGIDITGNGAIANTTGAITVADTDSVGIQVDGNEATVSNDGDSTITNGGTGTQVNGNDAQVNNTGNTTVDGKNSTGTEITGNNGTVNLDGSLIVTGGAYGVEIVGDSATLNNEGDISVADEGSIGVLINGEKATVSNTGDVNVSNNATGFDITTNEGNISLAGSMQVGDFSTGMDLNGNNNSVTLAAKDLNVTGQKATGVNVSGDANTINITGNVLVDKDQTADNAADYFYDPSVGINVSGSNNNVTLDGKLTVVADSELTTRNSAGVVVFDGSQENITGLSIAGDGNTFRLNGGIQLVGEANKLTDGSTIASERKGSGKVPLVSVDGKSSVHLNGDSTISGDVLLGNTQIIDLRNGAMLDVGADATINMQVDTYERYAMSADHLIDASSGSQLVNNGDINLRSIGFAAITGEDSFGSNTGNLTLSQYLDGLFANGGYGYLATKGASVVNTGTITTKVAEQESVINLGASLGFNDLVFYNAANSMTGLSAKTHGYVLNENGGKIEMFGRGNVGMLAIDESTAENAGQITLDALWVDVNDTTTLRDNIGNDARGYSVGMGVGTDAGSGPRKNATAVNQQSGVITVYNAGIGMAAYGAGNTVINQGTINLEKNGNYDSSLGVNSLIGMAAYNSGTAINDQTGVININADNGQAFYSTGNGVILNYGTICVNTNCLTGNDYNDTDSYTSILYTGGDVITAQSETQSLTKKATISDKKDGNVVNSGALSGADIAISSGKLVNTSTGTINNAIIINGGAGKLKVNNASLKGVSVNTGFTAGTSSTSVTFDNVVQGSNLTDAETITSTSVVWNAQGTTDASGNVDVTMTKNAYTDVATDSSVNTVAQVLDAGYTNNELYSSLNVGTTAELNSALKQVSGSQATTVFNEARVLSNRFSMLSDAAPEVANGLAFNVVAKGDPRAELGNDTQYDMMALRKSLTLTEHQNLSLEYGIARLEGNGSDTAGDNGVTGGYSQFFGLKHQMAFDNGMNWNNALRYDVHQLDSSRSVAYGDINKTADANVKQQYLEFRSEGAKTFELREGLNVTPYAGVKLRHTLEGGYQERNAGDFNLSMNSGSETAVDSIVGLKLDYAGKDGWSANATLEGGPNLSYVKSQRTASVSGAGSQRFNIDDGQNGGGFNSLATMGVKYSSQESALQVDAFHWKEDGISDKGVMLNFKKTF